MATARRSSCSSGSASSPWASSARPSGPRPSQGTGGSPHHLHALAAMSRNLELAEPGDPELGAALATDEEDLEVFDVLGFVALLDGVRRDHPYGFQPDHRDRDADEDRDGEM